MSKRNVLWCPRSRHRLAWLEVDELDTLVVAFNASAFGLEAGSTIPTRFPAARLDGASGEGVHVTCPCGGRWIIDLVAVREGRSQTPKRDTGSRPGVSYDRPRRKSV